MTLQAKNRSLFSCHVWIGAGFNVACQPFDGFSLTNFQIEIVPALIPENRNRRAAGNAYFNWSISLILGQESYKTGFLERHRLS
ncbi:hypothetical protein [Larkinella terrae]|uniref:Uncharacterized protein n=1 Tax=Larkinella terrae TaxID=2025311 RepID=A0A7K0EFZ8_9BACT|nr:hypothetical protein [Larkinella terrae]MRS60757.1 hypothetical protein [Larkinella terrae]